MKTSVYGSLVKKSRKLGIALVPKATKSMTKRPYPPGQHGQKRKSKPSDYAIQLIEKQKAKFTYGLREKQFKRFFNISAKRVGGTNPGLVLTLERRLDNVIYRSGFAPTRRAARQLTTHGGVLLSGKKISIPSYIVNDKDEISFKKPDRIELSTIEAPAWLKVSKKQKIILVLHLPKKEEVATDLNEQLIVEYYSR